MNAWAGMERFLNLSLGSQVGASGVALIAVLELKRRLQYPVGSQGHSETSDCIVRLTAEEWRTVAGIHERKTFERAKARLEELGVLRIERNGRLLEITLWPDPIKGEEEITTNETFVESPTEIPTESSRIPYEPSLETHSEAEQEPKIGTELGTSYGTSHGTGLGTCRGTSLDLAILSETGTASPSERVLRYREDVVFPIPDVPQNSYYPTKLDNNSLLRYPLSRYPLSNNKCINNASNEITNIDQRYNVEQDEQKFAHLWVQEVGHPLTPYEQEGLLRFNRLGYTEELFVEALRCAVAADNRKMGYVLGILRNWYQEGVRGLQDVADVKKQWEDRRFLKRATIC